MPSEIHDDTIESITPEGQAWLDHTFSTPDALAPARERAVARILKRESGPLPFVGRLLRFAAV